MDGYYIDLVLSCLGDAWKKLESAKGYAIRAGVPNTQRLDKLKQAPLRQCRCTRTISDKQLSKPMI